MVTITFIEHDGTEHTVDVVPGTNLKDAALDNEVPGIDGDCGGNCACATCHLYIEPDWLGRVASKPSPIERDMLGFADGATEYSRLGCQVTVDDALNGLCVRLPLGQH